jgi:TPR repeat protein
LSADQGNPDAQNKHGYLLSLGDGISMNKSLAAYYFKLSADQGHAFAQFNYGNMLRDGNGISMNKSLAAYCFKLSADQGNADAQNNYGVMLDNGDGISMNKSLAAYYYKLSSDQGNAYAQLNYGIMLSIGDGISMNKSLAVHDFKLSADQGCATAQFACALYLLGDDVLPKQNKMAVDYLRQAADDGLVFAQLFYARLLRHGHLMAQNAQMAAHYYQLAADQGSVEGQLTYAKCLMHGNGVILNVKDAERYFQLACSQNSSSAQMDYGIALLLGLLGRFDFAEAGKQFAKASSSNRFAVILQDILSLPDDDLTGLEEFSRSANVFSFLRDGDISLIRIMNPRICETCPEPHLVNEVWRNMARSCIHYLLDLSQIEETALVSLSIELVSCESLSEMIPLIFQMYSIKSQLYGNVNYFLRQFPIRILRKFLKELNGILNYIYLLQSSIYECACNSPITENQVVYRGLSSRGSELGPLYASFLGQVIVWKSFTSTSTDIECAMREFVESSEGILFEITLCAGAVAGDIHRYSVYPDEREVLIAAMSGFMVESIDYIPTPQLEQRIAEMILSISRCQK